MGKNDSDIKSLKQEVEKSNEVLKSVIFSLQTFLLDIYNYGSYDSFNKRINIDIEGMESKLKQLQEQQEKNQAG